ncbi:EVE domain-containing protein [Acidithiobacillus sp.]|uniref:EVE domain-containing protein n=1 Tax=Acidithiobacillus sp. TaxID=1872118 RepID=UPI0025C38D89|nr:EVE domain-containing protein [Acidithiobacillus sp.]
MAHWLLKTEPEAFSLDDLKARGQEPWDGIRNYQARNFLRQMRRGDEVFIYHSRVATPAIVGLGRIVTEAHPDPTQFDPQSHYYDAASRPDAPRWDLVDIAYLAHCQPPVSLETLREMPEFSDNPLVRKGNRLSIVPISESEWQAVLARVTLV